MKIDKEFLVKEIEEVSKELEKARVFAIQAETSIAVFKMLLNRLEQPESEDGSDLS